MERFDLLWQITSGERDMKRKDVIEYLRSLTDKQFVELFYAATDGRRIFVDDVGQSRLVLAHASENLEATGKWDVALIALHDSKEYPAGWNDDVPICQEAESLGYSVFSYAKKMICPITGKTIEGT
jgi:hypothetical protein